jgi:glycosidase
LFCLQFLLPGAPGIYYGDEIGLTGGKDPESRGAFPWNRQVWDGSRRELLSRLIALRKERPELRRGRLEFLVADDERRWLAFSRSWEDQAAVCVVSLSEARQQVHLPVGGLGWRPGREVRDGLSRRTFGVAEGDLMVTLEPSDCMLLLAA